MELVWKKLSERKYKAGWRKMINKVFLLPTGIKRDYDIRDDGVSSCMLVLTPDNKVILEKVFRPGPEKVLMEMVTGYVNENEDPKKSIEKELIEEIGYKGETEFVGTVVDDAYSNSIRYIYVSKNSVKVQEPHQEDDEILEIVEMDLKEFRKYLRSGQFSDVEAGYLALDYLNLLK